MEYVYFEVTNDDSYQVVGYVDILRLEEGGDMLKYAIYYWDGLDTHKFPNYVPNCEMKTNFLEFVESGAFLKCISENRFRNVSFEMDGFQLKIGDQVIAPMECDFENYVLDDLELDDDEYNVLERIYNKCNENGKLPSKYFKGLYVNSLRCFCINSSYSLASLPSKKLVDVVARSMAIELSQVGYSDYFGVVMALLDGEYTKALEKSNEL